MHPYSILPLKILTLIVPCFSLALNYHKLWLVVPASEFVLLNILGDFNFRQGLRIIPATVIIANKWGQKEVEEHLNELYA